MHGRSPNNPWLNNSERQVGLLLFGDGAVCLRCNVAFSQGNIVCVIYVLFIRENATVAPISLTAAINISFATSYLDADAT